MNDDPLRDRKLVVAPRKIIGLRDILMKNQPSGSQSELFAIELRKSPRLELLRIQIEPRVQLTLVDRKVVRMSRINHRRKGSRKKASRAETNPHDDLKRTSTDR
jgi:hypothetical protein